MTSWKWLGVLLVAAAMTGCPQSDEDKATASSESKNQDDTPKESAPAKEATPAAPKVPTEDQVKLCYTRLRQISIASIQYADDKRFFPHIGKRTELDPESSGHKALGVLMERGYIEDSKYFVCPASEDSKPLASGTELAPENLSYHYARKALNMNSRSSTLLFVEEPREHSDGTKLILGGHYARVDGTAEWATPEKLAVARKILSAGSVKDANLTPEEQELWGSSR